MSWKVKKGYCIYDNLSVQECWDTAQSKLGLIPSQTGVFIAKHFGNFIGNSELKPGLIREMVGTQGTIHYLILDNYLPELHEFTINICTSYHNPNTRYMIIRNQIFGTGNAAQWDIEISEKRSILKTLIGGVNINAMFHGRTSFVNY